MPDTGILPSIFLFVKENKTLALYTCILSVKLRAFSFISKVAQGRKSDYNLEDLVEWWKNLSAYNCLLTSFLNGSQSNLDYVFPSQTSSLLHWKDCSLTYKAFQASVKECLKGLNTFSKWKRSLSFLKYNMDNLGSIEDASQSTL